MYTMRCCSLLEIRQVFRAAVTTVLAVGMWQAVPVRAQLGLPRVALPPMQQVQPLSSVQQLPSVQPPVQVQRLPQAPVVQQLPSALPVAPATAATPAVTVPAIQPLPQSGPLAGPALQLPVAPTGDVSVALQGARSASVRELLRAHADVLEADPVGEPIRRQELLWVSPQPDHLQAALAMGFTVLRDRTLVALQLRQLVLRAPDGWLTVQALAKLRAMDPSIVVDFNHIYTQGGSARHVPLTAPVRSSGAHRVGLVDGGVDRQHAALRSASLRLWGCNGVSIPSAHGTAVASLLVGRGPEVSGAAAGAVLYAADVYCGQAVGGAAEDIATALEWLAHEEVAVINVSLVGPANRLLERAVQAMVRRGHLLVAAVGNDGPAAPPLYPAAYAGVVGVTAVNAARQVLPEAAQGPQVMFCARGDDVAVADSGAGYMRVRGTSFAAPVVAGLLAQELAVPNPDAATSALARLAARAMDLGAPGRDPVYGFGLLDPRAQSAPARVQGR